MPEQFGTRTAYAEPGLSEMEDGFDLLERASAGDPIAIAWLERPGE